MRMSADRITAKINPAETDVSEEKQLKALAFLKRIKTSRDRSAFAPELETVMSQDRECGEGIYYQLLHSDLAPVRRFALDFYQKTRLLNLKIFVKNIILLEDDIDNLNLCLSIAAGTIDRSELQTLFGGAISLKGARGEIILAFLKKECSALNIDYGRMLENAKALREQERKKRLERYDRNVSDEGVTLGGELARNIRDPAVKKYAAAALIALIIIAAGARVFDAVRSARTLSSALEAVDGYRESEAEASLAQLCANDPGNIEALFHLHRIYCENYKILEANQVLSQMISVAPQSRQTALGEVRNALFSGEIKAASAFFTKSWDRYSSDDDARLLKARYDYASIIQGRHAPADFEPVYSALESLMKKGMKGYRPYIVCLLITTAAAGELFDRARPHYMEALKTLGADDFKTQLACAYFAERSKNYDQALALFDRSLKDGNAPDTVMRYAAAAAGRIALLTGKHRQALDYYLRLRENGQPDAGTYIGLIEAYGELGDVGGLNAIYKEACSSFREELMIHYSYGVSKMKMAEYEEAVKAFRAAAAIDPKMAEAHYNIGRSLCAMADKLEAHSMPWNKFIDEAHQSYKKCLEQDPGFHDALVSLGTLALSKSPPDYGEAEKNFAAALKVRPDSREALFNLLSLARLKADAAMEKKYSELITRVLAEDEEAMARLRKQPGRASAGATGDAHE